MCENWQREIGTDTPARSVEDNQGLLPLPGSVSDWSSPQPARHQWIKEEGSFRATDSSFGGTFLQWLVNKEASHSCQLFGDTVTPSCLLAHLASDDDLLRFFLSSFFFLLCPFSLFFFLFSSFLFSLLYFTLLHLPSLSSKQSHLFFSNLTHLNTHPASTCVSLRHSVLISLNPTYLYPFPLPSKLDSFNTRRFNTPPMCRMLLYKGNQPIQLAHVRPHPDWFTSGLYFRIHSTYSSFSFVPASNVALDKTRTLNHQPVLRLEAAT